MKPGDWLVLALAMLLVGGLLAHGWSAPAGAQVRIYVAGEVYGEYPLDTARTLSITGRRGASIIEIAHGAVHFAASPCTGKFCVRSGWLHDSGAAAACLPNRVSLEILGHGQPRFDSINF